MNRSRPRSKPNPRRPVTGADQARIEDLPRKLFHDSIRGKRCQNCSQRRASAAHHVLYKQHLARYAEPLWDRRNSMALCGDCHERHHARSRPIQASVLNVVQIDYIFEVLGPNGYDYIRKRYPGEDPRLRMKLRALKDVA